MKLTTRTRVEYGIELPWERRERYGPQRNRDGTWSNHAPKGTVVESGTEFISLDVLEELLETDNSFGMGNAYILPGMQGAALEQAGLARRETRGGYYTRTEERAVLQKLLDELWAQYEARGE